MNIKRWIMIAGVLGVAGFLITRITKEEAPIANSKTLDLSPVNFEPPQTVAPINEGITGHQSTPQPAMKIPSERHRPMIETR